MAHTLGIEQLIVVFNKMDTLRNANDDEQTTEIRAHERFIECKEKMTKILTKVGFKTKRIAFIPISAINGENMKTPCTDKCYLEWYKGFKIKRKKKGIEGFTLFDALQKALAPNNRFFMKGINESFKMSIFAHYLISGVGHVLCGKVISGGIQKEQYVKPYPLALADRQNRHGWKVRSIERNYVSIHEAECGSCAAVSCSGVPREYYYPRPYKFFLSLHDDKNNVAAPKLVYSFRAMVFVINHPGEIKAAQTFER